MSSTLLNSTPRRDGFYMPAEWEPHTGCWMIWPERPDNWRENGKPAQAAFMAVAEAIAQFELVTMVVSQRQTIFASNQRLANVHIITAETDDAWMRDVGPTFVVDTLGNLRGIDWMFNAWGGLNGGLYHPWDKDDALAEAMCHWVNADRYRAGFVLEGGSIHVDGQGTCLTTRQCLLNPNRNPHLSEVEIENHLKQYLNVNKIIWLDDGVYLDETDGHIDNLACFVRPGEVLLTWTDDESDPQYRINRAAYEILSESTDALGNRLKIHKIHQPDPMTITASEAAGIIPREGSQPRRAGERLAASYVNFYIANGGIVMPLFDDPHDAQALDTLRRVFPDRKVVGVTGREILLGGGNIHCITQQQPKG